MKNNPPLRVPKRVFLGSSFQTTFNMLLLQHEAELKKPEAKTLLGYVVPDFQRTNDRWTRGQQVAFIESIYMGANIGSFMVNQPVICEEGFYNVLLDGLQRMTAIKAYFNGEFGVEGADGSAPLWTELESGEQGHLLRITFPWIETRYTSREQMMLAYERHNFSGTSHSQDDRDRFNRSR